MHSWSRGFYEEFDIGSTFCTFTPSTTQDEFFQSWVTWELPETTHTFCFTMTFMSLVHSGSLSRVRRKTTFFRYEWHENSTLRKVAGQLIPPDLRWCILCLLYILEVFSLVRRPTCILRYEWRENSIFQKVLETSHTSGFTMILISRVHSASLSLVGRTTSIPCYEFRENSIFQKVPETSHTSRWF